MKIYIKIMQRIIVFISVCFLYCLPLYHSHAMAPEEVTQEMLNCAACVEATMLLSSEVNTEEKYRGAFEVCKKEPDHVQLRCGGDRIDEFMDEYIASAVAKPGETPTTPQERAQERAQKNVDEPTMGTQIGKDQYFSGNTINDYIGQVLTIGSGIIGGLAVLKIMFAGVMYSTAAGNPTQQKTAKEDIYYAIIGIVLMVGANLFLYIIGASPLNLPVGY